MIIIEVHSDCKIYINRQTRIFLKQEALKQYYRVCYTLHVAETLPGNIRSDSHTRDFVLQQLQIQMRSLQTTQWRDREASTGCSL
jgi:NMD protein affecting ribosome stability and mRNA decay